MAAALVVIFDRPDDECRPKPPNSRVSSGDIVAAKALSGHFESNRIILQIEDYQVLLSSVTRGSAQTQLAKTSDRSCFPCAAAR